MEGGAANDLALFALCVLRVYHVTVRLCVWAGARLLAPKQTHKTSTSHTHSPPKATTPSYIPTNLRGVDLVPLQPRPLVLDHCQPGRPPRQLGGPVGQDGGRRGDEEGGGGARLGLNHVADHGDDLAGGG
jgi:hypothetical protein